MELLGVLLLLVLSTQTFDDVGVLIEFLSATALEVTVDDSPDDDSILPDKRTAAS